MLKVKVSLLFIFLSLGFLNAQELQTSDELTNLEVVTDFDCQKIAINTEETKEVILPEIQEVETVKYKLGQKLGVVSFPVTVRANRQQGE